MGVDQLAQALVRGGADVLHGPQHALHERCDVPLPSRKPLKARHICARPYARPCKGHSQQRRSQKNRPHLHANPAMTMHTRCLRHCCTGSVHTGAHAPVAAKMGGSPSAPWVLQVFGAQNIGKGTEAGLHVRLVHLATLKKGLYYGWPQ